MSTGNAILVRHVNKRRSLRDAGAMVLATVLMLVTNPVNPDPRVEREAQALVAAGLNVRIIGMSYDSSKRTKIHDPRGFNIIQLPNKGTVSLSSRPGWMSSLLRILRFYFELFKRLPSLLRGVSVVHCHDFDTIPIGYVVSKMLNVELVYDVHESYTGMFSENVPSIISKLINPIEAILAKRAHLITVGVLLSHNLSLMTGKHVAVVRNTPSGWTSIPMKKANSIFVVGYVGLMVDDRSILSLIKGFEIFSKRYPNSELRLAGSGPLRSVLELAVKSSQANIKIFDRIPYDEVPSFLSNLSITAVLYTRKNLNNYYSSPNKLFEAGLVGVPVLASDFGELGWLVEKYELGFTVNPDHPQEISEALARIYEEKDKLPLIGQKAREKIKAHFSWNESKHKLLRVYDHVMKGTQEKPKDR